MKTTTHQKPSAFLLTASVAATLFLSVSAFHEIGRIAKSDKPSVSAASGVTAAFSSKTAYADFSTGSHCAKTEAAVLMFHYFRPENDDAPNSGIRRLSIPPETLDKQMRELKTLEKENKIRVVPISALDELAAGKCPADEKPVLTVLTVDDAWSDAYDVGFPTFKKYGFPFSLSTISRFTGTGGLRYQGFADRKEISEMVASGYGHVLSHSLDHKDFGYLSDTGSESEVCDSKKELEAQFGVKVDDFVFPAGHVDGYADGWLKKCGYSRAFLTKPGKIRMADLLERPYSLPRLRVTAKTEMRSLLF